MTTMKWLHEEPTINEVVGSLIALLAVVSLVFLAIHGSDAAQTALVSVAGAAAGTYYSSAGKSNGNGKVGQPGPTPSSPDAPRA